MYKLTNDFLDISISSLGAELKSIKYKNEEYLYKGDKKFWHRSSPVLFPIVGKLKYNNYKYKNKRYSLPIHGFARFKEFKKISKSKTSICFVLNEDKETLKHYPFCFNLYITYTLKDEFLHIDYKINSKEDILFGFGAHPAFLLKANINDSYLEFEEQESQNALQLDLTNGCIYADKGKKIDSNILNLDTYIFKKDALIYKNLNSKSVSLKNKQNNKSVKIQFDNFSYLGIWAKVNAPYICIEPWVSCADYINTNHHFEDKKDIIKLEANKDFIKSLKIYFN